MIAVDTSSFIAYLQGDDAKDVLWIEEALSSHALIFPPVVLSEVLSDFKLPTALINSILHLPILPIKPLFWQRAGKLRSKLLQKKLKARLADTLIAQSCIDHQVPLITRDQDFKHFEKFDQLIIFSDKTAH